MGRTVRAVPSLRVNFGWAFTGNVIYALCQWGMLTVLAKLGTPALVGQFALGLAVTAPVFMFTNLQLRAVQATDAHSNFCFADYFTLRLVSTTIALFAIASFICAIERNATTRAVILLVAAAKSIECLSDVIAGFLQKQERLDRVAVSLMIRGLISLAVFALVFGRFHSLVAALGGVGITWTAVLMAYDLQWIRGFIKPQLTSARAQYQTIKQLLVLTLPLGIVMTLTSLTINVPRYFLEMYSGPAEVGIYAAIAYVIVAINLVVNALGQSATTRLAVMFSECQFQQFGALVWRLGILGGLIIALGVPGSLVAGRRALTLLYRPEYGLHYGLLAIMMAISGVNALGFFATCGLNAARSFKIQVPIFTSAALSAVLASHLLVPRYGLIGGASALAVATAVNVLGNVLALRATVNAVRNETREIGASAIVSTV